MRSQLTLVAALLAALLGMLTALPLRPPTRSAC